MMIRLGEALTEVDRSAVVPPVLCRDCRFCRPSWAIMVFPFLWPVAYFWRQMWTDARCRHPTSFHRPSKDFVTGRREKPLRMSCNTARSGAYDERCGPQARYWQARTYPAWLWAAGPVILGAAGLAAYAALLRLMLGGYP
jgi:hypothetical protein